MKANGASVLIVSMTFLVPMAIFAEYRWPLHPGQGPHGIDGTLAEFRGPRGGYHLHEGVDMDAEREDPVYLVAGGMVTRMAGQEVVIDRGLWRYFHVHNQRRYIRRYHYYLEGHRAADVRYLRDPETHQDISHLHFEEDRGGANPVLDDHLEGAPHFDTEWPQVIDTWFQQDNTATCLPDRSVPGGTHFTVVSGRIDIVSRAHDAMPDPGSSRAGLYRMRYLIRDRNLQELEDVMSFRFDAVPSQQDMWDIYQRRITFADGSGDRSAMRRYYYIATYKDGSEYDYWNTRQRAGEAENVDAENIDEARYPDNLYRVSVLAWDGAGHGGREEFATGADTAWVIVDNFLPIVASTDPDSGESGVPPEIDIKATFSEPVAESTITSSRVIVVEMGDPPDTVAGVMSYDDSTYVLTFDPDSSLEEEAEYEVTISDSLTDLAGNRLDGDENGVAGGDYSWRFTVGEGPLIYVTDDVNCIFRVLRLDGSVHRSWTLDPEDYYVIDICVDRSMNCYALSIDWVQGLVVLKLNSEGEVVDTHQLGLWPQLRCITTDNTHYYIGGHDTVYKYECATGEFEGCWEVAMYTPLEITYSYYSDLLYVYNCESWQGGWSLVEAWPTTGGFLPVYTSDKDYWYAYGLAVDDIGVYSCGKIWGSSPRSAGIRVWNLDLSEVVHYWEQESDWHSDQLEILGDNILCIEFPSVLPPWPKLKLRDKFTGDSLDVIYEFDDLVPFSMAVYDPSLPVGGQDLAGPEGDERILCFDDGRSVLRPERFSLLQNSPNPVVEYSSIGYAVPHQASVELKIYNVCGGLVRTLVGRSMGPGYYSVDWDGRDILGRPVSGGVYFYRLVAGDFTATRKMVVLR